MTTFSKTTTVADTRYEQEKNFDPVAYAEEVMKTVGADFHEDDPLFQTNEFRMHCYKILPCSKHFCHDWSVCPFAHFSERAKRRDPKEVKYTAIACPDMKKGEECPRGDRCPYSHNTFEYWLHPTRYRTRLCRDHEACNRKICFFAHKPEEVRVPTARPSLPVSEEAWPGDASSNKGEKDTESLAHGFAMPGHSEAQAKQANQLQAFLQGQNLHINTTPKAEPTFVDQVLNGRLPSSGVPAMSLEDMRNLQMVHAAQNLPFDSYFQSPGMQQHALHPMPTNNGCFSPYDGFQSFVPTLNGFNNSTSQLQFGADPTMFNCMPRVTDKLATPMLPLSVQAGDNSTSQSPFGADPTMVNCMPRVTDKLATPMLPLSVQAGDNSTSQSPFGADPTMVNCMPRVTDKLATPMLPLSVQAGAAATKAQPQLALAEVIQLLSNVQVAGSPTSVLAQRHMNQGGLMQHSFSAEENATSGVGLGEPELDNAQLANALMGLNGTSTGQSGEPASTLFGISL